MSELWHESTWTAEGHRYQQQITRVPIVTPKPLPVFGVQVHAMWSAMYWTSTSDTQLRQHLETLVDHHVKLIRVDYGWSAGQPKNASLDAKWYYNARFKAVLDLTAQLGLKVLVTIHQSPNWARPGTGDNVKQFPTDLAAWGRFCDQFEDMFGSHPALFAVEVWNEPNLQEFTGFSDPLQRAAKYAPVLRTACDNIMLTPVMFGGPSQCDDVFVKDVLAAYAVPVELWSVHPYMADQTIPPDDTSNATSKGRVAHYPAVRDVFRARSNAQIWWSEFGFSVHANTGSEPMWKKGVPTEEVSADYLIRQMRLAVEWGVAGVVVYCAYRNSGDVHVQGFSLIHDDGSPTKQLTALGEFFGG